MILEWGFVKAIFGSYNKVLARSLEGEKIPSSLIKSQLYLKTFHRACQPIRCNRVASRSLHRALLLWLMLFECALYLGPISHAFSQGSLLWSFVFARSLGELLVRSYNCLISLSSRFYALGKLKILNMIVKFVKAVKNSLVWSYSRKVLILGLTSSF